MTDGAFPVPIGSTCAVALSQRSVTLTLRIGPGPGPHIPAIEGLPYRWVDESGVERKGTTGPGGTITLEGVTAKRSYVLTLGRATKLKVCVQDPHPPCVPLDQQTWPEFHAFGMLTRLIALGFDIADPVETDPEHNWIYDADAALLRFAAEAQAAGLATSGAITPLGAFGMCLAAWGVVRHLGQSPALDTGSGRLENALRPMVAGALGTVRQVLEQSNGMDAATKTKIQRVQADLTAIQARVGAPAPSVSALRIEAFARAVPGIETLAFLLSEVDRAKEASSRILDLLTQTGASCAASP